jgi:hypothetical protein
VCVVLIYGFTYQARSRGDDGEAKGERRVRAWSAPGLRITPLQLVYRCLSNVEKPARIGC